jgi:hypothetical protein
VCANVGGGAAVGLDVDRQNLPADLGFHRRDAG